MEIKRGRVGMNGDRLLRGPFSPEGIEAIKIMQPSELDLAEIYGIASHLRHRAGGCNIVIAISLIIEGRHL